MDDSNGLLAPQGDSEQAIQEMWDDSIDEIRNIDERTENWKIQALPLARIKKIMKIEEFVLQELEKDKLRETGHEWEQAEKPIIKFMIAGEGPMMMSKACELLIRELTTRAWQHTERNRRRTLQRQDLHAAVGESEVFDFLIDIVPRVTSSAGRPAGNTMGSIDTHMVQNMIPPNAFQVTGPAVPDVSIVGTQQPSVQDFSLQELQNPSFNPFFLQQQTTQQLNHQRPQPITQGHTMQQLPQDMQQEHVAQWHDDASGV